MVNQIEINFLDGNKLLIDKDPIRKDKDPGFREWLIRQHIQLKIDHPLEALVLYVPNNENALKEYHNEDILFCLAKPVARFQNQSYHYTITNMVFNAELTMSNLVMKVDDYEDRILKGKCQVTIRYNDQVKEVEYLLEETIEVEEIDGELSELFILLLDETVYPDQNRTDLGPWNFYANGKVECGPWENYPCYW